MRMAERALADLEQYLESSGASRQSLSPRVLMKWLQQGGMNAIAGSHRVFVQVIVLALTKDRSHNGDQLAWGELIDIDTFEMALYETRRKNLD